MLRNGSVLIYVYTYTYTTHNTLAPDAHTHTHAHTYAHTHHTNTHCTSSPSTPARTAPAPETLAARQLNTHARQWQKSLRTITLELSDSSTSAGGPGMFYERLPRPCNGSAFSAGMHLRMMRADPLTLHENNTVLVQGLGLIVAAPCSFCLRKSTAKIAMVALAS